MPSYTSPVVNLPPAAPDSAPSPQPSPPLSPSSAGKVTSETLEVNLGPPAEAPATATTDFPSVDGSVESLEKLRRWRPDTVTPAADDGSSGTNDVSSKDEPIKQDDDANHQAEALLSTGYGSGCVELDLKAYKRLCLRQCSVHVGELHLRLNPSRKADREGNSGGGSRKSAHHNNDTIAKSTNAAIVANGGSTAPVNDDNNDDKDDSNVDVPLVTVLMPCFNCEAFVGCAVRSVLDQDQVISSSPL